MIEFRHDKNELQVGSLIRLFARGANWKMPRAQQDWCDLLQHSPLVVTAWHDNQLVGFARLLTDFVRWANLYDVVVDPALQRQGIGSQLVQRLLDHPRVSRVRTFWLGTAEGHSFYERFGFVRDGTGHGMLLVRRNRDEQLAAGSQLAETAKNATSRGSARPSFIVSSREVPEEPGQYSGTTEVLSHGRPIGVAAGLQRLGLHVERLPAGQRTSLPHAHEDEEEFVYVLDGDVDVWIDGCLHRMVPGDLAAFPAGTGVAHTVVNNSKHEALLLVGGERSTGRGRIHYPLNPERRDQMAAERWWNDVPRGRLGAWPAHAVAATGESVVLETDRLSLRWWRLDDADAMFEVFGDPAVHRYSGAEPYLDVAAARAWLEREVVAAPVRGFGHWAVVEKDSQRIVGSCGFRVGFEAGELELGFTIAQLHWGRGYATELAAACLRYGTERLCATRVLALTMPENAAARRVLEKVGLILRGTEQHDGASWCVYETFEVEALETPP